MKSKIMLVLLAIFTLVLGIILGNYCKENTEKNNLKYSEATLTTDLSNVSYDNCIFAEGIVSTNNPVTFDEIGGEYLYIEKVFYKKEFKTKYYTDSNGKRQKRRVREWERKGNPEIKSISTVNFCNKEYPLSQFELMASQVHEIKTATYQKYKYNGITNNIQGTLFININDNGEIVNTSFYLSCTAKELQKRYINNPYVGMIFIIFISSCISLFFLYKAFSINKEKEPKYNYCYDTEY